MYKQPHTHSDSKPPHLLLSPPLTLVYFYCAIKNNKCKYVFYFLHKLANYSTLCSLCLTSMSVHGLIISSTSLYVYCIVVQYFLVTTLLRYNSHTIYSTCLLLLLLSRFSCVRLCATS